MFGALSLIGPAESMALASSLLYALTLVAIRHGLQGGTPLAAVLTINTIVCLGGLTGSLLRGTLLSSSLAPLLFFALSGMAGQGIGAVAHYIGIERMGVSRSTLVQSITPIWGAVFAVAVLGERPAPPVWAGTLMIVGGMFLLAAPEEEDGDFRSWLRAALVYPLLSSVVYALVPIFAKLAFAHQRTPLVGMAVAFAMGNTILILGRPLLPGGGPVRASRRSFWLFALGGVFNLFASYLLWSAFLIGDISTVLPMSRFYPLFLIFFSFFLLREFERLSGRLLLATGCIVAGGVLVAAFRA
ncbi:MAG: EamA family transporter [bacterium]